MKRRFLATVCALTLVCTLVPAVPAQAAKAPAKKGWAKSMTVGQKKTFKIKNASGYTVKWKSTKPKIAKVAAKSGKVTALSVGSTTIKATLSKKDAKNVKLSGKLTVSGKTTAEETPASTSSLVRTTAYGQVEGTDHSGIQIYYGIPYGKNPVGELRWAAPQAPELWADVRNCTEKEEIAIQLSDGKVVGTTDCLNLDVYTTSDAKDKPVLVYVHGGNNQTGSSFGEFDGYDLVEKEDCVVVSLNYRTGLFGYNALPALTKNGTGNFGLLDIAFALQWVRDNIGEFGGDASNVTVSGFSAGGRDVMAMLLSKNFEGLFDRAIVYSGGMTICDKDQAAKKDAQIMAPLAVEDGKAATAEEAQAWLLTDSDEVREYLYGIQPERLASLMSDAGIRMAKFPHLFGDDIVLPSQGFDSASYVNDVPVIMLTGTTEFSFFALGDYSAYGEEADKANAFAVKYGSDFYRVFNTQLSAQKMSDKYKSNMYLCQVNYGGEGSAYSVEVPGLGKIGSFHGIFVPMISTSNGYTALHDFTGAGYQAMADVYNAYIKNFLKTGDPNSSDTAIEWTPWTAAEKQTLVLDAEGSQAKAEIKNVFKSNEEIIQEIEKDTSLSAENKQKVIQTVMNGRWFSDDLDAHFKTPSLW